MHYSEKAKKQMDNVLYMEEVLIPKSSVFLRYVSAQHAGAGWKGRHALRNLKYITLEGANPKYALECCYGSLSGCMVGLIELDAGKGGDTEEEDSNAKIDNGDDKRCR